MRLGAIGRRLLALRMAYFRMKPLKPRPTERNDAPMKLLILGAGATGGYFGGRLARAGVDVTFLVRAPRAEMLARHGLKIDSSTGNFTTPVKTVTSSDLVQPYDAIILSCKAYDLATAIEAIRPAVGPDTLILPLLNGLKHLDALDAAFGKDRVLGGTCHISVTLSGDGTVLHLSPFDALTFGPRAAAQSAGCVRLNAELARGGFELRQSDDVVSAMWEKWVLLATLAGMTCLMRANIGEIVATDAGEAQISAMLDECCAIAAANGHKPRASVVFMTRATLTDPASAMSASMLRDLQHGSRIEADHIIGDLIARAPAKGVTAPLLRTAYSHLQAYQNRLTRSQRS
jgi:2-dehydropantoate 2-reductase